MVLRVIAVCVPTKNIQGVDIVCTSDQTCSGSDEGSKKMEYSIYFGSDKRISLPIYGVEEIMAEWKFFYFFIRSI